MRSGLIALALLGLTTLGLATDAAAACRCACVRGMMRPICQQTDLVEPICAGICTDGIRPDAAVRPLAGGQQVFDVVRPANPAPNGLEESAPDLNTDTRGFPLGTAGVTGGTSGLSAGSSGLSGGTGSSGATGR